MRKEIIRAAIGGAIGAVAGTGVMVARLGLAATAPISYPVLGYMGGYVPASGILLHQALSGDVNLENPGEMVRAIALMSAVSGATTVLGMASVPLAPTEIFFAPLSIPVMAAVGAYVGANI